MHRLNEGRFNNILILGAIAISALAAVFLFVMLSQLI
jgi:hypothetical protein